MKLVVSAKEGRIESSNRNYPPEEGGKTPDHRLANQNAVTRIIECNDRKGANIVKSIIECQLREFAIKTFINNNIPFQSKTIPQ